MSWLHSTNNPRAVALAFAIGASLLVGLASASGASAHDHNHAEGTAAEAKDAAACAAFKWPIDKERAAFESPDLEKLSSGTSKGPWGEQVFALRLQPAKDVAFPIPASAKKNPPDTFGGTLSFAPPAAAGPYQITISNHSWIELAQNGTALKTVDHSGAKGCDGIRKSIRFNIGAAPVTLQVSGSTDETVNVSIRPVEPKTETH